MAETDQMIIPDAARRDRESFEILRVWVANQGQHVSLKTGIWDDPFAWGIILADLARHVANAYSETDGLDPSRTLERILAGLNAELDRPTDQPSGGLVNKQ